MFSFNCLGLVGIVGLCEPSGRTLNFRGQKEEVSEETWMHDMVSQEIIQCIVDHCLYFSCFLVTQSVLVTAHLVVKR